MQTPQFEIESQMLIRVAVGRAFEAFINPELTTRFWFTKSSGKLIPGAIVTWYWEMFNLSTKVRVLEIIDNKTLMIEWGEPAAKVIWEFESRGVDQTLVKIKTYAEGKGDVLIATAVDLKGGFTMVLAGAKALLEQGVELNLIQDQFPDGPPCGELNVTD
ncbi:SRPBCC domain-containing protein [Rubellicoccus peritrichatus]|uniref:SRPBCC domain-containing protein n=1 Tax=Rubellicoccus peritrichatus TaxID=3080537 RepID=A0AAQ3QUY1_9BACT|nr:SRPBCC domain-containing protein [Puniceicoccus sp. CR14]WOO40908.1 SRPBCC domain-containing protein [Puniceicoccus sp. CR14]